MSIVTKEESLGEVRSKSMTEEEFLEFCEEDIRAEFKDGEVIVHSPSSIKHGNIARFVGWIIQSFVSKQDLGHVMGDNIQVRLRPGLRRVPDLLFISKESKAEIGETEVEGAPDLIVEIVSSDSVERDWREKYLEYQHAGVREYWIIDPNNERFAIYCLNESGEYEAQPFEKGILKSKVLPGFWMQPEWLWQEPLPNVLNIAKELKISL